MADSIDTIAKSIKQSMQPGTGAYDTSAVVKRIEGNTAWVHIPGGVDETPVRLTMNAKKGDVVQVRVSGGSAWLVGNATSPPTDDTVANVADGKATEARTVAIGANETAENAKEVADDAKDEAEIAHSAADSAWQWADDAHNAATQAWGSAAEARDAALGAQQDAATAHLEAVNAQAEAEIANQYAQQAIGDAASASQAASIAQSKADEASAAADEANASADRALDLANTADENAQIAIGKANDASAAANEAKDSAIEANTYAVGALNSLGDIEQVIEALSWVTEHGEYGVTDDTTVLPGKWYFTRSGSSPNYTYTVVTDPTGNPHTQGWYELTGVKESVSNYVSTHMAITGEGLYIQFDNSSVRLLLSSDGFIVKDAQGRSIATYGSETIIGDENGTHIKIVGDRLSFYQGTTEVAWITGNYLHIRQTIVVDQMDVGKKVSDGGLGQWSWKIHEVSGQNNLYLKWLG